MSDIMNDERRTLTDGDVNALAQALIDPVAKAIRQQMVAELQLDIGRAVFVWCRRAIVGALLLIALWGFAHGAEYVDSVNRHN